MMTSNTKEGSHPNGNTTTEGTENQTQQDINNNLQLENSPEQETNEDIITLQKLHAILLNCINLTKKQKLEFAESERYFMKSYLKKLISKLKR